MRSTYYSLYKYTCYIEFNFKCLTHDIEYIVTYFGVAVSENYIWKRWNGRGRFMVIQKN